MDKQEQKLFVGGYYDNRIFDGDYFWDKTEFGKDINTYTLDEVLKFYFVQGVISWWNNQGNSWEEEPFDEKAILVVNYTHDDEHGRFLHFKTEQEAEQYKVDVFNEIQELEQEIIFAGKHQIYDGSYRDLYVLKDNGQFYIRFGDLPSDEKDVVCYKAKYDSNSDSFSIKESIEDVKVLEQNQISLIKGNILSEGSKGEVSLKNVKFISNLGYDLDKRKYHMIGDTPKMSEEQDD